MRPSRYRLLAAVERFDATRDSPVGVNAIVGIDPESGDWRLVAERRG